LHLHLHFTDPLFELSWTEYVIGQYTQYNKKFDCKIKACQSPTAMYSLLYITNYYKLLCQKFLQMYIIWSWLNCAIFHDLSVLKIWIVPHCYYLT
jgi:hypothetical protein